MITLRTKIKRYLTPSDRFVYVLINNHKLLIDTHDKWMNRWFLWCDVHEPETTQFIENNVQKNDLVLDIGAHIGYHSLNFDRAGAQVIAFEPDPRTIQLFNENTSHTLIQLFECVVTNKTGPIILNLSKDGSAFNSTLHRVRSQPYETTGIMIDNYHFEHIDWVKIDVEGAELQVLQGMKQTIECSPNLKFIIEWIPSDGGDLEGILQFLKNWHYRPLDHNMLFWRSAE